MKKIGRIVRLRVEVVAVLITLPSLSLSIDAL